MENDEHLSVEPKDGKTHYRHWAEKLVAMIREPFRGLHQGQRPYLPHQQAGHMTAPDQTAHQTSFPLATAGPSTHDGFGMLS